MYTAGGQWRINYDIRLDGEVYGTFRRPLQQKREREKSLLRASARRNAKGLGEGYYIITEQ